MLKTIGALSVAGICVVAVIGLAGGGPVWFRYVGASMVVLLLLAILGQLLDISKKLDPGHEKESDDEQRTPIAEDHLTLEGSAAEGGWGKWGGPN